MGANGQAALMIAEHKGNRLRDDMRVFAEAVVYNVGVMKGPRLFMSVRGR